MAKYGAKAAEKVEKTMHERKSGTLKSGSTGKKVTSKKQAIAIGLSEARHAGAKVPKRASSGSSSSSRSHAHAGASKKTSASGSRSHAHAGSSSHRSITRKSSSESKS